MKFYSYVDWDHKDVVTSAPDWLIPLVEEANARQQVEHGEGDGGGEREFMMDWQKRAMDLYASQLSMWLVVGPALFLLVVWAATFFGARLVWRSSRLTRLLDRFLWFRVHVVTRWLTLNGAVPWWLWMAVAAMLTYGLSKHSTGRKLGEQCPSNTPELFLLAASAYGMFLWSLAITRHRHSIHSTSIDDKFRIGTTTSSSSSSSSSSNSSRLNDRLDRTWVPGSSYIRVLGYCVSVLFFWVTATVSGVITESAIVKFHHLGIHYTWLDDQPWAFTVFLGFFLFHGYVRRPADSRLAQSHSMAVARANVGLLAYYFTRLLFAHGFVHYEGKTALLFVHLFVAEYSFYFLGS